MPSQIGVTGVDKDALQPLTDLSSRRGFAPVLCVLRDEDTTLAERVRQTGAFGVLTPATIESPGRSGVCFGRRRTFVACSKL